MLYSYIYDDLIKSNSKYTIKLQFNKKNYINFYSLYWNIFKKA